MIYGKERIIPALVIFVVVMCTPFIVQLGGASVAPEVELPKEGMCIEAGATMKTSHMQILNDWRNSVVRDANRKHVSEDGREFTMSLTNECMRCHTDKAKFCDRCHNYMAVSPYCWDCHLYPTPKESK
jgi:hypothetical protein